LFFLVFSVVYFCVILHELGHILASKILGYSTRSIQIIPLGAIAVVEGKWYHNAKHELIIAVSGPAVNLALFIISYFFMFDFYTFILFFTINGILFFFNLIPAFPMDGGRILRSILHLRSNDILEATKASYYLSVAISTIFALIFIWNLNFIGAAVLIFFGIFLSYAEYRMIREEKRTGRPFKKNTTIDWLE
jgi:stage IV sporulation protein FB